MFVFAGQATGLFHDSQDKFLKEFQQDEKKAEKSDDKKEDTKVYLPSTGSIALNDRSQANVIPLQVPIIDSPYIRSHVTPPDPFS